MNKKSLRLFFAPTVFLLIAAALWFAFVGINKTIEKTVDLCIYERPEDYWSSSWKPSSATIAGSLNRTFFSSNFEGTFAIEYCELSCRDGVEAKIEWHDGYQDIQFLYAGDFIRLDIKEFNIDESMESMLIVLSDGTIIKTPHYYVPQEFLGDTDG